MGRIRAAARYRELGDKLRWRREQAGVSGAEMAEYTGWSVSKISRIELGRLELDSTDVVHYLGGCGIYRGQALDLLAEFRDAERNHDYWLRGHEPGLHDTGRLLIHYERTARESISYEPQVIPGLLQIENYIRALLSERWPEEDIDFNVRLRMDRQQILHRRNPARFTFFISEQALRLVVGGGAVMQEQMLALTLIDALPHMSVRVVPQLATFGGAFRLFEFTEFAPLVYLDAYLTGLFIEDKKYVGSYRDLIPVIMDAALSEGESRAYVANLASEYDRGSACAGVEEEQL
jgi:transcriptional regulator with XRE-family HTH domain